MRKNKFSLSRGYRGIMMAVVAVLTLVAGCSSAPPPAELTPDSVVGVWKLEPRAGKKVTTLLVVWPRYFTQITGKEGNMSHPTRKIRYILEANEEHITMRSAMMPLDPPYELDQDMILRRTWPNAAVFTSRGKERYTKITLAQANEILGSWKIETVDPKRLEALPSGDE